MGPFPVAGDKFLMLKESAGKIVLTNLSRDEGETEEATPEPVQEDKSYDEAEADDQPDLPVPDRGKQ